MSRKATPRDGWNGPLFAALREARERSREWVAAETGVSVQSVSDWERNVRWPPHSWRDKAALALRLDRRKLGREGG